MPAIITHSFFAEDSLGNIKDPVLKDKISSRMDLFYLGAQGPDLFFYYKAKPWIKYDGIEKLGNIVHENLVDTFFKESFDYLDSLKGNDGFYDLLTYLAGYMCHYSLDRNTHPLIHYSAGIDNGLTKATRKYYNHHRRLESTIDYFSLIKKGVDPVRFKSFELVSIRKRFEPVLIDYYIFILDKVYGTTITLGQVRSVIHDISRVLKNLYDPIGLKLLLYRLLELLMGARDEITSSMIPRRLINGMDYLNLDHRKWVHPCNPGHSSDESFWDLYNIALDETVKFMDLISVYLKSGRFPDALLDMTSNISYSTGIECGNSSKLKYFDSIYDKVYEPVR